MSSTGTVNNKSLRQLNELDPLVECLDIRQSVMEIFKRLSRWFVRLKTIAGCFTQRIEIIFSCLVHSVI